MQPREIAAYSYLSLAWGLSFLFLLHVVDAFGWVGAVSFRCFIAGFLLLAVARLTRRRLAFSAPWRHYAAVGATTIAGQLIGLSYATPLIGTAMAAIFVAAVPLFSMVIARLWGLERITPARVTGIAFGAIGIAMLVGFPAVPVDLAFALGCVGMLFSTFSAALGSNYAVRFLPRAGAWEVTTGALLAGGLMTLPLLLLVPVPGTPQPVDYAWLTALAALMSATAYVVYFDLVSRIGPTRAISVEFIVTVIAVLIGALALGEALTALQLVGAAVILLGCALVLGLLPLGRRAA